MKPRNKESGFLLGDDGGSSRTSPSTPSTTSNSRSQRKLSAWENWSFAAVYATLFVAIVILIVSAYTLHQVNNDDVNKRYRESKACFSNMDGPIPIYVEQGSVIYSQPLAFDHPVRRDDPGFPRANGKLRIQHYDYKSVEAYLTIGVDVNSVVIAHLFHQSGGDDRPEVVDQAMVSSSGTAFQPKNLRLKLDPSKVRMGEGDVVFVGIQQAKINPTLVQGNQSTISLTWDCSANFFRAYYH